MDALVTIANLLFMSAYFVRDVRWLRTLALWKRLRLRDARRGLDGAGKIPARHRRRPLVEELDPRCGAEPSSAEALGNPVPGGAIMTDLELLYFAAKAAGIDVEALELWASYPRNAPGKRWNPMVDDGDALRLAVALKLKIDVDASYTETTWHPRDPLDPPPCFSSCRHDNDPCAATRRAIVAVAAEVGQRVGRCQSVRQPDDDSWMTGGPS